MDKTLAIVAPLLALITLPAFCPGAASGRQDFMVKAGVMEPAAAGKAAGKDVLRETAIVTLEPSRRPGWCFLVDPPNDERYEVYSIHHLPGTPKSLGGDFLGQSAAPGAAGIKTDVRSGDGIQVFCFDFHSGDPLGEYQVEVFINRALKTTIRLQVVAPDRVVGGDR
jgi:hypothetical protein